MDSNFLHTHCTNMVATFYDHSILEEISKNHIGKKRKVGLRNRFGQTCIA